MPNRIRKIKCHTCDHTWLVDLDELDKKDQTIYKDANEAPQPKTYRVECPRCQVTNIFQE